MRLSTLLCRTLYVLRADAVARATIARRRVSILMYHQPSPEGLDRHLQYLVHRYAVIPLATLVDALHEGRWGSVPQRALALTFDDGTRATAGLVDVLRRYEVPATFYVCSAIAGTARRFWFEATDDPWALMHLPNGERLQVLARTGFSQTAEEPERSALDRGELARVAEVGDIGSHTRFHPPLTTCTDEEAELELRASREEVEALTGRPCLHLCFPHGIYGPREVELAREAGYRSARTIDIGWNGPETDPFRLRILGTVDDGPLARLAADLSGVGFLFRRRETGRLDGRLNPFPNRNTGERQVKGGLRRVRTG